jgi:hypothetical protein
MFWYWQQMSWRKLLIWRKCHISPPEPQIIKIEVQGVSKKRVIKEFNIKNMHRAFTKKTLDLQICVSIPHNYPLIIKDRHKNFEDSMPFLKCSFHGFYIQFLNPPFFWDTLYFSKFKRLSMQKRDYPNNKWNIGTGWSKMNVFYDIIMENYPSSLSSPAHLSRVVLFHSHIWWW